jgi:hypothetical protein
MMKIAVIHDWLINFGGDQKVLKSIINIYPDADVFSVVCSMTQQELAKCSGQLKPGTFF